MPNRMCFACAALLALLAGCIEPVQFNKPLARFDQTGGYRFRNLASDGNSDDLFVILTFSGGGTRAAALSYGVLQQVRNTTVQVAGEERRLLDEVDVISAVSGGSFTAAYYAAFGERVFEEFEDRFLNRSVRTAILCRILLLPHNWLRLYSSKFDAGDLAERYYAKYIFEYKRFQDLLTARRRPFVIINATDMTLAMPFEFTQDQFDLLYSDLDSLPISKAVASSAAYPCVLAGLVLRNYVCRPDFTEPAWISAALEEQEEDLRRFLKARQARSYARPDERPYIHVFDGGISDNLGLDPVLWSLTSEDSSWSVKKMLREKRIRKVVVIVVNATVKLASRWDRHVDRPTVAEMFDAAISGLTDGRSFESLARLNEVCDQLQREFSADNTEFYVVEVSFDRMASEAARDYCNSLPTDLQLPKKAVENLRLLGARLLLESPRYQELIRDLGGSAVALE